MQTLRRRIEVCSVLWALLAGVMFVAAAGCGSSSSRASVNGAVTLDGKPIEQGYIVFNPLSASGGPTAGGTILNGAYRIAAERGVVLGRNRVEIRAIRKTGRKVPGPMGGLIDEFGEAIPAKYHGDSILEEDITAGINTIDFALVSKDP